MYEGSVLSAADYSWILTFAACHLPLSLPAFLPLFSCICQIKFEKTKTLNKVFISGFEPG